LYLIAGIAIFTGTIMRTKMISIFYNKRTITSLVITLFVILSSGITFSQTTRSHTITVIVNPVTVMQLIGGTINLNITGANAIAGQDQMSVTDQTTTILWGINRSLRKITIKTDLTPQKFAVTALAVNPTVGTAATEVTLSTAAYDLLTDLGRSSGSASIRYTGIALASQGTGSESHFITMTIAAQ
jgi:hypothetical protein